MVVLVFLILANNDNNSLGEFYLCYHCHIFTNLISATDPLDHSNSIGFEIDADVRAPPLRRRFTSTVGQHSLSSLLSNRNSIPQGRINPMHLTANQQAVFKCPPRPSRKYVDVYHTQQDFNNQPSNTFTPLRRPMEGEILTPSNRPKNPLNVSHHTDIGYSQQLQMPESPLLRSTPINHSMNWRGRSSPNLNTYALVRIPRNTYNDMYTGSHQDVSHIDQYNRFNAFDVTPMRPIMTPNRQIRTFCQEPAMSMDPSNLVLKHQNLTENMQQPTGQTQYIRYPVFHQAPESMGLQVEGSTQSYVPDGIFWDQNLHHNNNYPTPNYQFQQTQPNYGNLSFTAQNIHRTYNSKQQHPVSSTYIPPRFDMSSNDLEGDKLPQEKYNVRTHDTTLESPLLLFLDDHLTEDDYKLKTKLQEHYSDWRQTQSIQTIKRRKLEKKMPRKGQINAAITSNTKCHGTTRVNRKIKEQKLLPVSGTRLHKKKLQKRRRYHKDPLYRPPYRISQMTFARRILPFRRCRLTNPFGCSPFYVVSLPRCVERVLEHNRTNLILPQNKHSIRKLPSRNRPSPLPLISSEMGPDNSQPVHTLHQDNTRHANINTYFKLNQHSIFKSRAQLALHRNAKSRRISRKTLMQKQRSTSKSHRDQTGYSMTLRCTNKQKVLQNSTLKLTAAIPTPAISDSSPLITTTEDGVSDLAKFTSNHEVTCNVNEGHSDLDTTPSIVSSSQHLTESQQICTKMDKTAKSTNGKDLGNIPSPHQENLHDTEPFDEQAAKCQDRDEDHSVKAMTGYADSYSHTDATYQIQDNLNCPQINVTKNPTYVDHSCEVEDYKTSPAAQNTLRNVRNSFIMTDDKGNKVAAAQINLPKGTRFKIVKVVSDNPKVIALTSDNKQPTIIHEVHNSENDASNGETSIKKEVQIVPKYKIRPALLRNENKEEDKWLKNLPEPISTKTEKKVEEVKSKSKEALHMEDIKQSLTHSGQLKTTALEGNNDSMTHIHNRKAIKNMSITNTLDSQTNEEWIAEMKRKIHGLDKPPQKEPTIKTQIDEVR